MSEHDPFITVPRAKEPAAALKKPKIKAREGRGVIGDEAKSEKPVTSPTKKPRMCESSAPKQCALTEKEKNEEICYKENLLQSTTDHQNTPK